MWGGFANLHLVPSRRGIVRQPRSVTTPKKSKIVLKLMMMMVLLMSPEENTIA
jgi:hypothetical protein